jgi:hypothetical protein
MPDNPPRTTIFVLTGADALAYEQASARLTPIGLLALLLWLGAWAVGALLLPSDWIGPRLAWASSLIVSIGVAIGYVLALLLTSVRQALAARRRVPRALEVTLTEFPDRLELTGADLPPAVPFRAIRESRLTPTHLLLNTDDNVIIVPRRAFADPDALDQLAAHIASRPAVPAKPAQPRAVV